jgi:hypothetical protein
MWNVIFGIGAAILLGLVIASYLSDWVRREFARVLRATGLQNSVFMKVIVLLDRVRAHEKIKASLIVQVEGDENYYQVAETEMTENDVNDPRVVAELNKRKQVAVDVHEMVMDN